MCRYGVWFKNEFELYKQCDNNWNDEASLWILSIYKSYNYQFWINSIFCYNIFFPILSLLLVVFFLIYLCLFQLLLLLLLFILFFFWFVIFLSLIFFLLSLSSCFFLAEFQFLFYSSSSFCTLIMLLSGMHVPGY